MLLTLVAASAPVHAQTPPSVRILNPEHDAVVTSRNVTGVLWSQGVLIRPALDSTPGNAHYHLLLDVDIPPADSAIPYKEGYVHLNRGQTWHEFLGVQPGTHRLIALLAGPNHKPLRPLVADTVRFTVKPK